MVFEFLFNNNKNTNYTINPKDLKKYEEELRDSLMYIIETNEGPVFIFDAEKVSLNAINLFVKTTDIRLGGPEDFRSPTTEYAFALDRFKKTVIVYPTKAPIKII